MIRKLTLLLAIAAGLCAAGDRPALAPEAADFLKWYEGFHGSFYPQEALKAYREQLAKDVAAPEVERRIELLVKRAPAVRVELLQAPFNKFYNPPTPPFRQAPSNFLARIAGGL